MENNVDIKQQKFLYKQYFVSEQQVLDAWVALKILYSKLANAYDAMCQKFFEKPETKQFGHTVRYCITKQYKPVISDVFYALNCGFKAGQEFSEPLFFERRFCEYYTPDKMCIVNGCNFYSFNNAYFKALYNFQIAFNKYQNLMAYRKSIYDKILCSDVCVPALTWHENICRSVMLSINGITK